MQQKLSINVKINDKEFILKKNYTILQACLWIYRNKFADSIFEIPRFCFHEKLSIAGNCRMCLVEVLKSPKPVASCAMPLMSNMEIKTNTSLVKKAREGVLEFILANHPLDCPICDQGGECDLQDQSMIFGGDIGRFYEYKRAVEDKECGPFVKTVMTRCIHCTRCVRYLSEIAGISDLGVLGRGNKMEIGTYLKNILHSEVSGNVIDLCPVGALTSKPYTFTARPWELITKQSVDIIDNIGADIRVDIRGTEIMRILPRYNSKINDMWISDITRFSYDSIKKQRLCVPMYKNINSFFVRCSWKLILDKLWSYYYLNTFVLKRKINVSCLGGNLVDSEAFLILKEFNKVSGSKICLAQNNFNSNLDIRSNYLLNVKRRDVKKADCLILLGTNLRLESPVYNLYIRHLFLKKDLLIFSNNMHVNLTYYVKSLGINIKNFVSLIEGKNILANLLTKFNNIVCLVGMSVLIRSDYNSILSMFTNFSINNINFKYGTIQKNISSINSGELGFNTTINSYYNYNIKSVNNIITSPLNYIINVGNYDLQLSHSYNQYQIFIGHHGYTNNLLNNINILLPSKLFMEKFSSNLNMEGKYRRTKKVLTSPGNSRLDWEILYILNIFFNKQKKQAFSIFWSKFYELRSLRQVVFKHLLYRNNIHSYFDNLFFNESKNLFVFNFLFYFIVSILLKNKYFLIMNLNKCVTNIKVVNNLYLLIFNFLENYYLNSLLINKISLNDNDIKDSLEQISPLFTLNNKHIVLDNHKFNKNTKKIQKINNYPFINYMDSIYTYDILSKTSVYIAEASKQFKLTNSNYQ